MMSLKSVTNFLKINTFKYVYLSKTKRHWMQAKPVVLIKRTSLSDYYCNGPYHYTIIFSHQPQMGLDAKTYNEGLLLAH